MSAADVLLELIAIRSVSSASNRPVVDYAKGMLEQAGWRTREMTYPDGNRVEKVNLIAAPPLQDVLDKNVDLALVCHTDTVPYAMSWKAALKPFIKGGTLYGCGACDVKGFLACLLESAISGSRHWLQGLRIILTADEEVGCVGARYLVATAAIQPRRLVIGEPTRLHVARAGKGYCLAEVVISGVEAHSAHPDEGSSAIYAAGRMIGRIEQLAANLQTQKHELFQPPYTTLNVGTIQGGSAKNIIPGECRFLVEWRPIPGLDRELIPDNLKAFSEELERGDPRIRCDVHLLREQVGFETSEQSSLVQALVHATGKDVTSIPFGSEASILAALAEETVVFGPGDMRTAHSDRERVSLVELAETVRVLRQLMGCLPLFT